MRHSCPAFKPINECHVSKLFSKAGSTITLFTFMRPLILGWHSLHLRTLHHCKCTGGFIGAGFKQKKNECNHNLMHKESDHHQLQSWIAWNWLEVQTHAKQPDQIPMEPNNIGYHFLTSSLIHAPLLTWAQIGIQIGTWICNHKYTPIQNSVKMAGSSFLLAGLAGTANTGNWTDQEPGKSQKHGHHCQQADCWWDLAWPRCFSLCWKLYKSTQLSDAF